MVKAIMFDIGRTLDEITFGPETVKEMLEESVKFLRTTNCTFNNLATEILEHKISEGWNSYNSYTEQTQHELKPEDIAQGFLFVYPQISIKDAMACGEGLARICSLVEFKRTPRPYVRETLSTLKAMGFKLGVVSNTSSLYAMYEELEEFGLRDFFSSTTLSSVTGYRKPSKGIFDIACRDIGVKASECVYVGDSPDKDIAGAQQAGFYQTVQIGTKAGASPTHYIRELTQLIPIAEGWKGES